MLPETKFALTASGSSIAYQSIGGGDVTIVSVPPMAQNIENAWGWPTIRHMFEGFASFARWVAFDKRGTGMSDRSLDIPRLDERVDEVSAVLDHTAIDRTFLMGTSEGGPMALMFAATYPDRVMGIILESTTASLVPRSIPDPAVPPRGMELWGDRFVAGWGTPESITVDMFAPSLASDAEFRRWHQSYERNAASRDAIASLIALASEMDATDVLHRIECPVLMIHRVGDRVVPIEAARDTYRQLRSHGVDVEFLEQQGEDHFLYAADLPGALSTIERFTTGKVTTRTASWRKRHVEIVTMGRFDVVIDGSSVATAAWGSRRARTLLKRLVAARGWPVTRDELIDTLWPEAGDFDRMSSRLSVQLSAVRRILGGGIIADRSSVRLDLNEISVDIIHWFALGEDAAIVAGYHGELFPDDRYDDWTAALRTEVRARFCAAAHRTAAAARPGEAIGLWRQVIAADIYDDDAHRQLIGALRSQHRHGEARTAYQTYIAAMEDIGIPAVTWESLDPAQD